MPTIQTNKQAVEQLKMIVTRAKAIQSTLDQAAKMESIRVGKLARENYIRTALVFVEEVSKLNIVSTQVEGNK